MATGKEIVKAESISEYAIATINPNEFRDLVQSNLGGLQINPTTDLTRIKIPTGGMTAWSIPTLDGDDVAKEVTGVIIGYKHARAYWPGTFAGGNQPPQCVSEDGICGVGNPGGDCASCEWAQWGSKDDGKGQQCKSILRVFMVRPGSMLPTVFALPPTSIKPFKQYIMKLLDGNCDMKRVITKFELEKAQNGVGIDYAKVKASRVASLDEQAAATIKAYADSIMPMILNVAPVNAEYIDAGDIDDPYKDG
jgi:hypothetical protein